ncbi:MAG: YqiJ family protein [Reichenbachiella sp.]
MIELALSSHNIPFTVAVCIMFSIALMEGVGLLFGVGFSNLLDSVFPDIDIDADIPDDFQSPDFFSRILTWLRVGKVPILVLVIVALTAFGVIGFLIQIVSYSLVAHYWPAYIASIPAVFLSIPVVRISAKILNRFIPEDESDSISVKTFIGKVVTITLGTATLGHPAEAKFKDEHGHTHYMMVEPDAEEIKFPQGSEVILLKQNGSTFQAMLNNNQLLTNKNN